MSPSEIDPIPSPAPPAEPAAPTTGAARPATRARVRSFALAAGVVAGLASWAAGEKTVHYFRPRVTHATLMGSYVEVPIKGEHEAAVLKNARLAFGILGASVGLALGLAGGLAHGSVRAAVVAGLAGLVAGGSAGFATSEVVLPIFLRRWDQDHENLFLPLLMHGGVWSAVGAAGGLALGLGLGGLGRAARGLLGGLVGGALGAVAFEVIGGFAFPLDRTVDPVSATWVTRLLARLCVGVLTAACAALLVAPKGRETAPD